MIKRILEVSNPSYLYLRKQQLIIEQEKTEVASVPVEDIGILILAHPAIVITQPLVIACGQQKAVIIFCDDKHLPYSAVLPLQANTLHQKILEQQIGISQPTKKRLWQQIIQHKIKNQISTLRHFDKPRQKLEYLLGEVKSGDGTNCESTAAQYYWKTLFGKTFRRDQNRDGVNALLNYGYSIMRAMMARSISAAGLHPALGLFHHNQYNAFCLADDLMEPCRPWVDAIAYQCHQTSDNSKTLVITQKIKALFLKLPGQTVTYKNERMPLMVSMHYLTADLKRNYTREITQLKYPQLSIQNFAGTPF